MSAVDFLKKAKDLLEQECEEQAIEAANEALNLEPDSGEAYLCRAEAYRLRGRSSIALKDYRKALEFGADAFKSWLGTSICQFKQRSFVEADESLGHALTANGDSAEVSFWRGRVKMELNDLESAIAYFSKAVALDSDDQNAKAFLSLALSKHSPPTFEPTKEVSALSELFEHGHPQAKAVLDDKFFWSLDDYSPIGDDIGFDSREAVLDWRKNNPQQSAADFLKTLFDEWGYDERDIRKIANEDYSHCIGEFHLNANVYDDTVVAVAFSQFMLDGYLDPLLGTLALRAMKRQRQEQVLDFRASDARYLETRNRIEEALLKMTKASGSSR